MADFIPTIKIAEISPQADGVSGQGGTNARGEDGQPFINALASELDGRKPLPSKAAPDRSAASDLPPGGESLPPDGADLLELLEGMELLPVAGGLETNGSADTELPVGMAEGSVEELPNLALAMVAGGAERSPETDLEAEGGMPRTVLSSAGVADPAKAGGFAELAARVMLDDTADVANDADGTGMKLASQQPLPDAQPETSVPLSAQGAAAADKSRTMPPPDTFLQAQVGKPGWSEELGGKVVWLINQQQQGAELRLNPPHLGPLEVRITIQQDQASVAFTAHHAVTREALEAAIPRLREMLGEQGLNLVDVNVSQHSFARHGQDRAASPQAQHPHDFGPGQDDMAATADASYGIAIARGLVDYYV